jgi:RimJ/RimL family protein N-acetyltransferase
MPYGTTDRRALLTLRLADGRALALREVAPDDTLMIARLIRDLSERSRRMRYLVASPSPELARREAIRIASDRTADDTALVVTTHDGGDETAVALGELWTNPAQRRGELAIIVRDAYQRLGIGTILLSTLVRAARAQGLRTVHATTLAGNRSLSRLLRRAGVPHTCTTIYGELDIVMYLAPQPPARSTTHRHQYALDGACMTTHTAQEDGYESA